MASGFHPKVTSTALAGALTSIIIGVLNRRGITLAPDEAAAVTVLLSFIAGYFMPDGNSVAANGNTGTVAAGPAGAPAAGPQPVAPPAAPVAAQPVGASQAAIPPAQIIAPPGNPA